jgi:hypothetical protein
MDTEFRNDFIYRSIEIIAFKRGTSIQAIKIMKKVMEMLPKYTNQYSSYNSHQTQTLSSFVIETCEKSNLIHILLDDLQNYLLG